MSYFGPCALQVLREDKPKQEVPDKDAPMPVIVSPPTATKNHQWTKFLCAGEHLCESQCNRRIQVCLDTLVKRSNNKNIYYLCSVV